MENEIKYIGFYDLPNVKSQRLASLAAINKMDYIAEAINSAGYNVHIVSPSWSLDNALNSLELNGRIVQVNQQKKVTLCNTYPTKNRITKSFKIIQTLTWLFFWLLNNTSRNEKVFVYHAPALYLPLMMAKYIVGFEIVLEVEEIYGKVWSNSKMSNRWEKKLIKNADSYIAVSNILAELLGTKVKAIVYGNYSLPKLDSARLYFANDKINIVYAGSIDETKGGAFNAVKCAELLPDQYIVHISGHGSSENVISKMKNEIDKVNVKLNRTACVFHGTVKDEDFVSFLSSCQIAINPQLEGEKFRYLFPSKIIKYLSCNLRVVSTDIESVRKSPLSKYVIFSENENAETLVESILSVDLNKAYNSISIIEKLNKEFIISLKKMLNNA